MTPEFYRRRESEVPCVEMPRAARPPAKAPLLAVALVWLLAVTVVLGGAWADRAARARGPETSFAAYAVAIERGDLEAALGQLVPEARERSASWVEWQLGNRYRVLESVVRTPSLLDRLAGTADDSTATVVVSMEIEGKGNPTWRAVEEVPARFEGGRWLLVRPPLEGR